ncbi:hypothetical protein [Halomarina litorea]|uniref:hypothetical protein n=1 Tax=Halomarina litorea TaxID=2961595 RepID=UPI0020C4CFB7|nr:hypothetical protein [Halomarina sp. BCD28]
MAFEWETSIWRRIWNRFHSYVGRQSLSLLLVVGVLLTRVPLASAHEATATAGLTDGHGLLLVLVGIGLIGGAVVCKRLEYLSPTVALYGVFVGIVVTALGAVLFEGLSPDPSYTASSVPFPRSWYEPLGLAVGLFIAMASFAIGWLRWPTRPRYTFLGLLMGLWVSYPYLVPAPAGYYHPLGYAIVLGTPILVGYIVWTDAGTVLRAVLRDPIARRFGAGVGFMLALFFTTVTGYLSLFPEEGIHETTIVVLPVVYQLVMWPTLEIVLPHIPFFLAISPGLIIVIGVLSSLIELNAAVIARHWRVDERAGMTQGTAGSAAIVGTCTCGCCGPLVAKLAVLAAGPAIAAPLYWVFVDTASPLSALFIVGSFVLFTGSLVYSIEAAQRPDRSTAVASMD